MSFINLMTTVAHHLIEVLLVKQPTLTIPAQDFFLKFSYYDFELTISLSLDSVPMFSVPSGSLITMGLRNSSFE